MLKVPPQVLEPLDGVWPRMTECNFVILVRMISYAFIMTKSCRRVRANAKLLTGLKCMDDVEVLTAKHLVY